MPFEISVFNRDCGAFPGFTTCIGQMVVRYFDVANGTELVEYVDRSEMLVRQDDASGAVLPFGTSLQYVAADATATRVWLETTVKGNPSLSLEIHLNGNADPELKLWFSSKSFISAWLHTSRFSGESCGLCGFFDGDEVNDFVEGDALGDAIDTSTSVFDNNFGDFRGMSEEQWNELFNWSITWTDTDLFPEPLQNCTVEPEVALATCFETMAPICVELWDDLCHDPCTPDHYDIRDQWLEDCTVDGCLVCANEDKYDTGMFTEEDVLEDGWT